MIISKLNRAGLLCYIDEKANASKIKSRMEKFEQIDLNFHCLRKWPKESKLMFHVVNESGGKGDQQYGDMLNRMGRKSGVPDWPVMIPSKSKHGLYIELKRSRVRDSSISKESKEFAIYAESKGYVVVYAYGYKSAMQAISDYFKNKLD